MGKWEYTINNVNRIDQYLTLLAIVPPESEDMELLEEKLTSYMEMPEIREEGDPKFPVQDGPRKELVQYLNWNAKERMKVISEEAKEPEVQESRKLTNQLTYRYDQISYQLRGYEKLKELFADDFDFGNVESRLTDYTKTIRDRCVGAKDVDPKDFVNTNKQMNPMKAMDYIDSQDGKMIAMLNGKPVKRFHVDPDYYTKRVDLIQASFDKIEALRDEMKGTKKKFFSDSSLFKNMMSNLDTFLEAAKAGKDGDGYMSEETIQKYNQAVKSCDAYVKARSGGKLTNSGQTRLDNAAMIGDLLKDAPQKIYAKEVEERSKLRAERAAGKSDYEVKTGGSNQMANEERSDFEYLGRKDCMDYDKMLMELHNGSEDLRKDFAYEYNKLGVKAKENARKTYEFHMEYLTQFHKVPEDSLSLGELISPDAERGKKRTFEVDESGLQDKKKVSMQKLEKEERKLNGPKKEEKAKTASTVKKTETVKKAPEKNEPERNR